MTDLLHWFITIANILVYKDLLCVQNAETLSLKEIHLSNVLLNDLKCLYIICDEPPADVLLLLLLLLDIEMFGSMKNKEKEQFDFCFRLTIG